MKAFFLFCLISLEAYAGPKIDFIKQRVIEASGQPVVIFDLDDTLFYTSSRTLKILKEFASSKDVQKDFPLETQKTLKLKFSEIAYDLKETLQNSQIKNPEFINQALIFWKERFFSGDYLRYDKAIEGSAHYVNDLYKQGAMIIYLTGRDHSMRKGSIQHLALNRFPIDVARTELITKEDVTMSDVEYKKLAFKEIARLGEIVAFFENEPKNLNAMIDYFPKSATAVFLDTKHSPAPDRPYSMAIFVKNFND